MKSGASDPFAEEEGSTDKDELETSSQKVLDREKETKVESVSEFNGDDNGSSFSREQLPYVLRREKVKDERPEVHQLFVQLDTHDTAVKAERDLEDRLNDSLARTDAREAIYLAGMQHLDEAETILREWGYDF